MGSRPPTLHTLVHRAIVDERLFARGDRVLVATSGGPDSTALLHALALLRKRIGHELVAVGIDHGLRPEACAELDLVHGVADKLEVPFDIVTVSLKAGSNLQARARAARHDALQRAAAEHSTCVIATGHTADDRAETVLLRLLRGAGREGLAVLPARAPSPTGSGVDVVRPLWRARRSDVMAHLVRHRIPYAEDPSNRDSRFLRARVRHELLPLMEELSPGIVTHLCTLADLLAQDEPDPWSGLGRAQRLALRRALEDGADIELRLRGGRELRLQFFQPRKKEHRKGRP